MRIGNVMKWAMINILPATLASKASLVLRKTNMMGGFTCEVDGIVEA